MSQQTPTLKRTEVAEADESVSRAEIAAISKSIRDRLQGVDHKVALIALLLTYVDVAKEHPCCAHLSAVNAMHAGALLMRTVSPNLEAAPSGTSIH